MPPTCHALRSAAERVPEHDDGTGKTGRTQPQHTVYNITSSTVPVSYHPDPSTILAILLLPILVAALSRASRLRPLACWDCEFDFRRVRGMDFCLTRLKCVVR